MCNTSKYNLSSSDLKSVLELIVNNKLKILSKNRFLFYYSNPDIFNGGTIMMLEVTKVR